MQLLAGHSSSWEYHHRYTTQLGAQTFQSLSLGQSDNDILREASNGNLAARSTVHLTADYHDTDLKLILLLKSQMEFR